MSPSDHSASSFWKRLGRALANVLKLLLFLALIAIIAAGAWLGYRELVRSLNVIADRTDLNAERIELMRRDVDTLITDTSQEESLSALQASLATQETQIADLQSRLDGELSSQQAELQALHLQVSGLISHTNVLTDEVATLQEGIVALQGDLNTSRSDLDQLGGDLDGLNLALEALDEQFEQVSEDAGELASMQQALTLFRIWELVARARLYLLEGNAGLAAADLDAASLIAERLVASPGADSRLLDLQERLSLARESLPGDAATANRDLETAWETLDALLADRVEDAVAPAPALTITPTLTVTSTLTPTISATGTPAP